LRPFLTMAGALAGGVVLAIGFKLSGSAARLYRTLNPSEAQTACVSAKNAPPPPLPALAEYEPDAPAYDPVALLKTHRRSGPQIFAGEKRREPWASTMEAELRLRAVAAVAAIPEATVRSLECRAATCRIVVAAPDRLGSAPILALQRPALSPAFALEGMHLEGSSRVEGGFLAYSPETRTVDAFRNWVEGTRRRYLGVLERSSTNGRPR
jgi:hypothetical protein